jgi:hypothetical protein
MRDRRGSVTFPSSSDVFAHNRALPVGARRRRATHDIVSPLVAAEEPTLQKANPEAERPAS